METQDLIRHARAWLQRTCPNTKLHDDLLGNLLEAEAKHYNCSFIIGPDLTKQMVPHLVHFYSGEMFVFPLSRPQFESFHAADVEMRYTAYTDRVDVGDTLDVEVTLDELKIENASNLSSTEPIQGRCTYSMRGRWPGLFALGLQYELTQLMSVTAWDVQHEGLTQQDGALRFCFPPTLKAGQEQPWTGTTAVFLRLYTVPDPSTVEGREPFSNACAGLIEVD